MPLYFLGAKEYRVIIFIGANDCISLLFFDGDISFRCRYLRPLEFRIRKYIGSLFRIEFIHLQILNYTHIDIYHDRDPGYIRKSAYFKHFARTYDNQRVR